MSESKYSSVNTRPVKRFFVEMLTRDIGLEDAILDLLDNCVDGIVRSQPLERKDAAEVVPQSHMDTPYAGFWAKITVNGGIFEIEDNCGGIPWDLHERAFRMGRPKEQDTEDDEGGKDDKGGEDDEETVLSVGVYGIGMKRAIFKMGSDAIIWTQNGEDNYQVPISAGWLSAEDNWDLGVHPVVQKMDHDGTHITVKKLLRGVSERFSSEAFIDDLLDKIESHYAVILRKGFNVEVNGTPAKPEPIQFRFDPNIDDANAVRPYLFKSNVNGVEIFLSIGLREPIPDVERTLDEQSGVVFSSDYAGWTVICNDRVVLYCNRDELTGWGTAGIPRYHTQFIAISGIVEFRGDARKLPTTTTKRGLDFSSPLYQQVLNRMREGLSLFVAYTNKWKAREEQARSQVSRVPALSFSEVKQQAARLQYTTVRTGLQGEQFKPRLPEPPNDATDARISYFRERDEIAQLAERAFGNSLGN